MKEVFDKLDQYESRFSGDVWTNLNKTLVKQRKQKKQSYLFYGLCFAFLFSAVSIGFLFYPNTTNHPQLAIAEHEPLSSDLKKTNDYILYQKEEETGSNQKVVSSRISDSSTRLEPEINDHAEHDLTGDENLANPNSTTLSRTKKIITQPQLFRSSIQEVRTNSSVVSEATDNIALANIASIQSELNYSGSKKLGFNFSSIFTKGTCPTFGNANYRIYTWSHITGLIPLAQFRLKNSTDNAYKEARENTEQGLISVEGAIGFGMVLKKGYYVEAGIQYAHWREKFTYVDPESVSYQTVITIDSIFEQMDTIIRHDTSTVVIPGSREIVNFNSHKSYNIPVVLGFQKTINEDFSFSVKAGAIINIQLSSQGKVLNQNMVSKNINPSEAGYMDIYRTKLSTQWLLGGQLNYHVTPEVHAYVSPQMRFTTSDLTKESYSLRQTYINPSLTIGLKYFL